MEQPIPYLAYLIRLWPTRRGGVTDCRVSLQCAATGQRSEFADLESLTDYLRFRAQNPGEDAPRQFHKLVAGSERKEKDR